MYMCFLNSGHLFYLEGHLNGRVLNLNTSNQCNFAARQMCIHTRQVSLVPWNEWI